MSQNLKDACIEMLTENKVLSGSCEYIPAGQHQFKTLWVRDFCFSVAGLLKHKPFHTLIKNQLNLFIHFIKQDGLIPRGVDCINPKTRVLLNTAGRFLPNYFKNFNYNQNLKPEYMGEHQTIAIDSNLLVLIASAQYGKIDPNWFTVNQLKFTQIFNFYNNYRNENLITQPRFSDWQDSSRREGKIFYTQILYLIALKYFRELHFPLLEWDQEKEISQKIFDLYYDKDVGLFKLKHEVLMFSLESQLWCIEFDLFKDHIDKNKLYSSLKKSTLYTHFKIPGRPIHPNYSKDEISWTTKMVGLRHYHDELYWSWLMGESAKLARLMNDRETYQNIINYLSMLYEKHRTIHEVYELKNNELVPFRRLLYSSEYPFTWGLGKILEAIE